MSPRDRERVFVAVAAERRAIAALIESLDAAQLATPSLCAGWDVKTVAAHLVSDFEDGFWVFWPAVYGTAVWIAGSTRLRAAALKHLRPTSRALSAAEPIIGSGHRSPGRGPG